MSVPGGATGDPAAGSPALRLGARTSPLARTQADWVAARLAEAGTACEFVGVVTTGDVDQRDLTQIGGTGVFAQALRSGLLRGTVDVGVHSLKDLPTAPEPGLRIAAVPAREDVRDVLVGRRLADLDGARVGTGSPRRAVQLTDWARVHGRRLEVVPVRGNVDTRIAHVTDGRLDAVVLAAAGLRRLGRLEQEQADGGCRVRAGGPAGTGGSGGSGDGTVVGGAGDGTVVGGAGDGTVVGGAGDGTVVAELVPAEVLLPAAGQGALAVECLAGDHPHLAVLDTLDDELTRARVVAERSFLATLEAGCLAPVGVLAELSEDPDQSSGKFQAHDLTLTAVIGRTVGSNVAKLDRHALLRLQSRGAVAQARQVGQLLAEQALTRLGGPLRR